MSKNFSNLFAGALLIVAVGAFVLAEDEVPFCKGLKFNCVNPGTNGFCGGCMTVCESGYGKGDEVSWAAPFTIVPRMCYIYCDLVTAPCDTQEPPGEGGACKTPDNVCCFGRDANPQVYQSGSMQVPLDPKPCIAEP